jgi:formamidopyrimidine-DNA glycosylase
MPELPEVETIARGVDARVRGDRVVEAWFSGQRGPFKTPAARQARGLAGRAFLSVHRAGKHIVCELGPAAEAMTEDHGGGQDAKQRRARRNMEAQNIEVLNVHAQGPADAQWPVQAQWIVHLGMTGRLLVTGPDAPVAKHTHARLSLMSGRELRFVDPRRFGRLEFRELARVGSFSAPGAEPLEIGAEAFAVLFRGRRLPIKAALLNQTLLAGVGNIYADESLFHAGIRPRRAAGRLKREELERLRLALRRVLTQAIKLGGSSVSDYVDASGERGFFQLEHCVYLRTGEPCRHCGTAVKRILIGGRGTHFCPLCQQ